MKIKNKSFYFIIILILTIIITRIITLYLVDPNIILGGFELHHIYYGIILMLITFFLIKKQKIISLTFYAISLGLIIDELEYTLRGFGNTEIYSSTLPSVIILTLLIILITLYLKYKK